MVTLETTLALDKEVLEKAQDRYRELGFARVEELISTAREDYLRKRSVEEKNAAMRRAAEDPQYQRVLRGINEDFAAIGGEGLPPDSLGKDQ